MTEVEWGAYPGAAENGEDSVEDARELVRAKKYGSIDQDTLEAILVGLLVHDDVVEQVDRRFCDPVNADKMVEAGIRGDMFENKALGEMFDEVMGHYRTSRRLITKEEAQELALISGGTQDDALMFGESIARCHAAMIARRIGVSLVVDRFKNHYYSKAADSMYQAFVKERASVGPRRALENFRSAVRMRLADPDDEPIREHDLAEEVEGTVSWLLDMKEHPDRHRGAYCGIPAIDRRTTGFHPGQLVVFVGKHGGYKTTTLINVAHGLFKNGYNVLYASLEMEARLMEAKLLCRYTRKLRWSKLYCGLLSEPGDWKKRDQAMERASDENLPEDERRKAAGLVAHYNNVLSGIKEGEEEIFIAKKAIEEIKARDNRLVIVNVGQSQKIKTSQLEAWLEERREEWQPDVVIVDYLALVASDTSYPDRRDLEAGDVCKYFRSMGQRMGFGVVTAAQFKRGAIERIRKYGFDNPEKAGLDTDDIAESNQIGADADCVCMIWPEPGGNQLTFFWPKARHMATDVQGEKLQVDQDHCAIDDDIASTEEIADGIGIEEIIESANRAGSGETLAPEIPDGNDDFDDAFAGGMEVDDQGERDVLDDFEDLS